MKTRKSLAMALTIVLSLTAGALLVWQISPRMASDQAAAPDAIQAGETPDVTKAPGDVQEPGATTRQLSQAVPDCQFGFMQAYNEDGSLGERHCLRSAYWGYTTETLEQMVYADAEAARVLAHRLKDSDYPRALRLALRSAALSGGDVTALMEARVWRSMSLRNGDADIAGLSQAYVLVSLAHKIRYGSFDDTTQLGTRLRNLADDPDATFQRLDDVVRRLYDDVRRIELDVTGQSTIGGDGDA